MYQMLVQIIKAGTKVSAREVWYSRHGGCQTRAYVRLASGTDYSRLEHGDVLEADEIGRVTTCDFSSIAVVELKEYATVEHKLNVVLGNHEYAELKTCRRSPSGAGSTSKCEKVDLAQAKAVLGATYDDAKAAGYWSCGDRISEETAKSLRRV